MVDSVQPPTHFDVDVIGEVFEFVGSGQTAEFSVVVVRSESVVSASLYVDGSQIATERTAVPEQEVGDLRKNEKQRQANVKGVYDTGVDGTRVFLHGNRTSLVKNGSTSSWLCVVKPLDK